jgi:putative ABC transport system permease protein
LKKDDKDKVILGKIASGTLKKKVGDKIQISGNTYQIVGIFESGVVYYDGGAIAPLDIAQKLAKKDDGVTSFYVKLKKGSNIEKVGREIERRFPDMAVIKSVEEYGKVDEGFEIIDAAAWIISMLAIVVGGIGVMNTMVMSVYERTREIGILRAVGWKKRRVLTMILGEAFLLSIVSSITGSLLGIVAVSLILRFPVVRGLIEPSYSTGLFVRALIVALTVGLLGVLYPAYRAVRILPMEALRYE